jgi:UPF0042 nucleotide-binding protein
MTKKTKKRQVLLVTGLSGAGLSTALKALEDMGYQAVDNIPLSLIDQLLDQKEGRGQAVAIGIDSRAWDFSATGIVRKLAELKKRKDSSVKLVFIDCESHILQKRFTETRRVHPQATDRPVKDGVMLERQMMKDLKKAADHVIDTSDIKPYDLRHILTGHFDLEDNAGINVSVMSFGFKNGLPREADLVFDVRFLDNPYWDSKLRPLSGLNKPVAEKIKKDKGYKPFFKNLTGLLSPLLPRYDHEGKHYLTIAIGCTGGRHRSVFVAEELSLWLKKEGYSTTVRHRDTEAWAEKHGRKK